MNEDYVSLEVAKLLKKMGLIGDAKRFTTRMEC